jgi:hypothetical protein
MLKVRISKGKFTRFLAREGIAPMYRRALTHLRARRRRDAFELEQGTETSGLEPLWKLNIDSPNARYGEQYEATAPQDQLSVLKFLNVPVKDYSFIDLGCGNGRTLIVASRFCFGKTIGVGFAQELPGTAQANLALQVDAAELSFPSGDKVVYLYNPFSSEVPSQVLDNLRVCRQEPLYVVYKSPRRAALLDGFDFLRRYDRAPGAQHIAIWQGIVPEARSVVETAQ